LSWAKGRELKRKTPANCRDGRCSAQSGQSELTLPKVAELSFENGEGPMRFMLAAIGACVLLPLIATAQTAPPRSSDDGNGFSPQQIRCLHGIHGQGLQPLYGEGFLQHQGRDLRHAGGER
jgi:hypothetical protein